METIAVSTSSREQAVDITREVQKAVTASGVSSGVAVVCVLHTTAGITINENADPDVTADIMSALAGLLPRAGSWSHVEGNSDAHVKSAIVGQSVTVPVEGGRLQLGTWQAVYFCEFDGPRQRRVIVQVLGAV
ncbi:MAG: secondary thiamine-phosphate synthase enzyme YjbQ [Armatimonadota bacterium]